MKVKHLNFSCFPLHTYYLCSNVLLLVAGSVAETATSRCTQTIAVVSKKREHNGDLEWTKESGRISMTSTIGVNSEFHSKGLHLPASRTTLNKCS